MSKIVDKEEKRSEILNAAIRVLSKKGTAGTTIQSIADEARIAKGTIYLYFKNKDEILREVLHSDMGSSGAEIMKLMQSDLKPEQKLRKIIILHAEAITRSGFPIELMPEVWSAVIRSPEKSNLEITIGHFIQFVTPLLRQIFPDAKGDHVFEDISAGIIAMFHGLIILYAINPDKFDIEQIADTMTDYILHENL